MKDLTTNTIYIHKPEWLYKPIIKNTLTQEELTAIYSKYYSNKSTFNKYTVIRIVAILIWSIIVVLIEVLK